jgi:hypothetical protein
MKILQNMELLQNYGYDTYYEDDPTEISARIEIGDRRFHEIRMRIESIVELCQEGEISAYEAYPIISLEYIYSLQYMDDLREGLDDLEGDIIGIDSWEKASRDGSRASYQRAFDAMEKYYNFTKEALVTIRELPESKDYQQKRKGKLKNQIIRDGLILSEENTDAPQIPKEGHSTLFEGDVINDIVNHLFGLFPEFKNDYHILFKHNYLEKRNEGLHWKKSKQSLAEYFHEIKPLKMKRMQWKMIENVFDEKDLKHSLSTNGNSYTESSDKKHSKDYEEWLKIKTPPQGK